MEREMKPRKKRVMEPSTEPVMEREIQEMNREMREMNREMREMNREMRELKADIHDQIQEIKRLIGTLSTQGAPADWNLNPRPSLDHRIKKSEERVLQLRFANKLADKIFTGDKIRDVSDRPVQINLIDTINGKIEEVGPLSSAKIEFIVLDDAEDQEFNAIIVNQRDKGPLLKGQVIITLTAGVGTIQDLSFVDNSSWTRTKKFKLGARVKQSSSMDQVRIKEAISEAFAVRDHRVKRARKHDLPSLKDAVWHLKKVKKDGKFHTRLIDNNIQTVKDFLDMYKTEPEKLRKILKDCTDQDWKAIEQDVSCVVPDDVSTDLHQGIQNGLSQAICPDLAMSTNAQGEQGDFCFHNLNNGDSGRNSSQILSEVDLINKMDTHPTTESSQNKNGLHSHISAVQPASSALDDGKLNANSNPSITQKTYNSPTTAGLLPHESQGLHQGFAGMHNNYNSASLSHHNNGFLPETVQNLASWPVAAMPTHSPNFNAQWPCNVIFQHQNNGYGDPGRTPPQFNRSDSLFIQSSQISNGLRSTTGQLPHEYSPGLHQGNNYDNASLSHHNPASWAPAAMPTYSPQLPCNVSFQHQNNGYGDPGRTPPQFNGSDSLFIQSSQIRNGLHAQFSAAEQYPQNTVKPPSDSSNELAAMVGNLTPNSMQNGIEYYKERYI